MAKYRKRPLVVDAYQYQGGGPTEIETLEGVMSVKPGDWIITGVKGERYACDNEIFRLTYEAVNP